MPSYSRSTYSRTLEFELIPPAIRGRRRRQLPIIEVNKSHVSSTWNFHGANMSNIQQRIVYLRSTCRPDGPPKEYQIRDTNSLPKQRRGLSGTTLKERHVHLCHQPEDFSLFFRSQIGRPTQIMATAWRTFFVTMSFISRGGSATLLSQIAIQSEVTRAYAQSQPRRNGNRVPKAARRRKIYNRSIPQ